MDTTSSMDMLRTLPPGAFACGIVGLFILWAAFWSVFCVIFQRNLNAIPAEHRKLGGFHIWLLAICPVSIFWMFFVLPKISASWRSWFESRGDPSVGRCGLRTGLWSSTLGLISNLLGIQPFLGGGQGLTLALQTLSILLGLAGFIFLIAFCIIISDLRHKAAEPANPI